MNVPEGTVLARAKRERWTQQIATTKHAVALPQSSAITPMQSIAAVMQERGERYRERMAGVSEKVASHLEVMTPPTTFLIALLSSKDLIPSLAGRSG
jgi:hypothetical protein